MTKTPVNIRMSLRVWGDQVHPEEISAALGSVPTASHRKGDIKVIKKTGKFFTGNTGLWRLESELAHTATFEEQVSALLARVTSDVAVWDQLAERHNLDLFCGVFLLPNNINQVFEAPRGTIQLLADRHLAVVFDCYSAENKGMADPEAG